MRDGQTTVAERHRFIEMKLKGYTLSEIAEETGWSFYCVRYWWRCYRDGGWKALDPLDGRKERGGHMSTFPALVRFAFLRIKKEHPRWGAEVARPRVAEGLNVAEVDLPCVSTIEKYWAQFGDRLCKRRRKRTPSQKPGPKPREPHERWQADFKVKITVEGLGTIDVFNIRDDASPIKIGSFVHWHNKWNDCTVQNDLRQAFTEWGLCDRLQTDKEPRLVSISGAQPFPSRFTLWLVGLGIKHELAPSAQANGCVERFNRTWYERVIEGQTFQSNPELQSTSDQELKWINGKLPSRGRACNGRPPLEVYPQAKQPRRPYTPESELEIFSMDRVYQFLDGKLWWRKASKVGQIEIGSQRYAIGRDHGAQEVRVTFDADTVEFVVEDSHENLICRLEPKGLTVKEITGLDP
jgi:hypothetical protein